MKTKLALALAVLAVGSLTACGGTSNTVTPAAAGAAAPASSAAAPTPEAKTSGTFGDTITFPSGVAVKVSAPAVVPAAPVAAGGVEGKIVTFDIAVTNGGKEQINAAMMGFPKVSYGASGTQAQLATDIGAGIGGGNFSTILPGETQTMKVGYGIPSTQYGDVRMEVQSPNFTDKAAIFKGAAK